MRIAVDGMGGDHAPEQAVKGALAALAERPDLEIVLLGRRDAMDPFLTGEAAASPRLTVVDCPQVIGMDDKAVDAVRGKPDSSIVRMSKLLAGKEVDAVVSAGNTAACVASCVMRVKRLPGVDRPGILVVVPTFQGPAVLMDVGANPDPKPENLRQYAEMATIYAREFLGFEKPKVGLMSIGEEAGKGNRLVKETFELLSADTGITFHGNVEGRDVFRRTTEVVICEGFVGNVVLKLMESIAEGIFKSIRQELAEHCTPETARLFEPVVKRIWERHDYAEYGGAPLLGVDGICIICHGSSDARAIKNAVFRASDYVSKNLNQRIVARLGRSAAEAS
jgi:glycerol-3-phosphate acyltransferase PlsX